MHADLSVEIIGMTTQGDRITDVKLLQVGGKSLFVKELEQALLEKRADIAVHSMKDVPVELPNDLTLPVILARDEVADAMVAPYHKTIDALPEGARVGTSSLRRQCQIRYRYPQLDVIDLRGNVNTRLQKLAEGEFDAIILAHAGLNRLQLTQHITQLLPVDEYVPAVGQGALGIECRADDPTTLSWIAPLQDEVTTRCVHAERWVNAALGGGCHMPLAVHAYYEAATHICINAMIGLPDGSCLLRAQASGQYTEADNLAQQVAEDLFRQGADAILRQLQ